MLRADVWDECHVRPRHRAQRSDLAHAAHAHLRDEHLRLLLEAEHGQRQADLVVQAALGPDRRDPRRAQRAEDVLRRRLARRADDGDDLRLALRANEAREGRKRAVLVVGDQRRRTARARVLDVRDAAVERDEEVTRPGVA